MRPLVAAFAVPTLAILACATGESPAPSPKKPDPPKREAPAVERPNVLLIIADDLGVDKVGAYEAHPKAPPTPSIDALADQGVRFDRAWSTPVCSSTRATLLTGRYGFRTGVGQAVQPPRDKHHLSYDEITLPEMLEQTTDGAYQTAAFGKWHLSVWGEHFERDPNQHGFGHFSGAMSNLKRVHCPSDRQQDFFKWDKTVDGQTKVVEAYATVNTTDDVLAFIDKAEGPWFAWVAYHAPHAPYHAPPDGLYKGKTPTETVDQYDAMVQAMDHEIGRLIEGLGKNWHKETIVVFVGDNGTPSEAVVEPFRPKRAKHTVFEGGVRVPLIVAGPGVAVGEKTKALATTTDLFATVAELAGADMSHRAVKAGTDSVSWVPVLKDPSSKGGRKLAYTERFGPNGSKERDKLDMWAIRDDRYKLVHDKTGREALYDLKDDWQEGRNIYAQKNRPPEVEEIFKRLKKEVKKLRGD